MKSLILALLLVNIASAQNYTCGHMTSLITSSSRQPVSCGFTYLGAYSRSQYYRVDMMDPTGVSRQRTDPNVTANSWCGGSYLDCGEPEFRTQITVSGSNSFWQVNTIGPNPGGALGAKIPFTGCNISKYSNWSATVSMPTATCACVSSTCGLGGCPACPCRSMCGTQCMDSIICVNTTGTQKIYPVCATNITGQKYITCPSSSSPIVIDWDASGISLTSAENGRVWTFFPDEPPVHTAWIDPVSTNAFLVLDRNGNGEIDDGTEMFGNVSPQPDTGVEKNGFAALALFDENHDGVIDARDPVFADLRLMRADGSLHPLREYGVVSISLAYHPANKTDKYGNVGRFQSRIETTEGKPHAVAWDWWLVTLPIRGAQ